MSQPISDAEYDIKEHIHRFACWAASRAASTSKLNRFSVDTGKTILNDSGLKNLIKNPNALPGTQEGFDMEHRKWRKTVIRLSGEKKFTHGVAAKLINVYLKTILICGGYDNHANTKFIHPPIDSVLLKALAFHEFGNNADFWKESNKKAWSNFDSEYYEKVIKAIETGLHGAPLWSIEKFWRGYQ